MPEETFILNNEINITALLKARGKLRAGIDKAKSELEQAGAIQFFEFTYELAWKTMKRILAHRGIKLNSPKEVFRAAAKEGLIEDPAVWFEFIEDRNETVHTYNEDTASNVFNSLAKFETEVSKFIETIQKL